MDEILSMPQQRELSIPQGLTRGGALHRLVASVNAQTALWRTQFERIHHRRMGAHRGFRPASPLTFLAAATVIGIAAVTNLMYTPGYVVSVDGQPVGIVESKAEFRSIQTSVEARVADVLGEDYALDRDISYQFALTQPEELASHNDLESYLFNGIDVIAKNYILTVDGEFIGATADRAQMDALLETIAAPYVNENTTTVSYSKNVQITQKYTGNDILGDTDDMLAVLTENTSGQTTYEVKSGDTFSALAQANDMSMDELEALNPDINIDRLYIGQILNVKEIIPFLGVQTVESVSYKEAVASPVREVDDNTMYEGESKVIDPGIPGTAAMTADVTYENGIERERNVTSSTIILEPTEKVIAVGTVPRPTWYPTGNYIWPVYGNITSGFGYRYIFGSYSLHSGIDIANSYGTTIRAADGGTVIKAGYDGGYGYLVAIDHGGGEVSYYGHNSSLLVSVGDKVYQGQAIAKMGSTGRSTGNHCHFEIRINNTAVNPYAYLP